MITDWSQSRKSILNIPQEELPNQITRFRGSFAFLSNMSKADVNFEGDNYSCVEAAFQAAKLISREERARFIKVKNPVWARRMGRSIKKLRPDWDEVKLSIMETLIRQKFSANETLRRKLLATGERLLAEDNDWGDDFWGTVNGEGMNHLGQILMKIRSELAATETGD